uniref:fasciclin domain-containing protein n=1 Tax=Neptunomonas sp. TaxID=1971898 RepID=UPI003562A6A6
MLLMPENKDQLVSVLTYHVVSGKVNAADVVKLESADTVQGEQLMIKTVDGDVMVNNAKVVMTDVEASNGVIHVIDTVLLPE